VEKTAGFILVNTMRTKVVMVKTPDGCYGFPKGHTEPSDRGDILKTAKRETAEEIGVKVQDKQIVKGFKDHREFKFVRSQSFGPDRPAGPICKHIDLFLAVIPESTRFRIQKEELRSCGWVPLANANALLERNLIDCGGPRPHPTKRDRMRMLVKTLNSVRKALKYI